MFELVSSYLPAGDQPSALARLTEGILSGARHQTLLGVTGSGKTFTIANVIANMNRPTLVISHNKTLAAQLYAEFRGFFPNNSVEYFVSYFDYYQPEAYIPRTYPFVEKDSSVKEEIERITRFEPLTGEKLEAPEAVTIYPGKQFVTPAEKLRPALLAIREELGERIAWFEKNGKLLEAQRLKMRTEYDLEMMEEMGFCSG